MDSTHDENQQGQGNRTQSEEDAANAESKNEDSRRRFLKLSLGAGLVLAVAGIASVALSLFSPPTPEPVPPSSTQTVTETVTVGSTGSSTTSASTGGSSSTGVSPFPRVKVANTSDLVGGQTVTFNYPLEETPNVMAKLGEKAEGGVGPDGDIVAFSLVCQHLGCIIGYVPTGGSPLCNSGYNASGPVGYCCCHGSVYDLANGAKVLSGPAPRPVPQVALEYDSSTGDIYAIGMGPPTIFGYDTGSSNVLNDLLGGTPVS